MLLVLAAIAAPAALADGVVLKSTSIDYPVGSAVKDGEVLLLTAGQKVTILDRSGVVLERTAGAYAGPSAREAAGVIEIATALATGPQAKSAIGGVRCSESEKTDPNACEPVLMKQLRVTRYVPARQGAAAKLVLESNFDGYAICSGWNPSEDSRFIAGADPAHPVELSAAKPAQLGSPKKASANPALKSASCVGVSIDVWQSLTPSAIEALNPNSAAIVLSSFSKLRNDTIAEARAPSASVPQP
jgi:hypothetical protein